MIVLDDEDKKKNEDDKYFVEEEKLKTVFTEAKAVVEEEEEIAPQDKEGYEVKSQLLLEETNGLSPVGVSTEMRRSFLEYAMSVIVSRALPDARDGLKPVHRRILFGMHELGITASVPHKKSARIVGDVLGKYHPHGDSAVYEAMVRMAQDFSMRYPLVDGHGNFGSIDGDGAAAMRYTEARMSKVAALMVDGIRKDTVKFMPNYDGSDSEPVVLPARIPNLLITGATGIAVGMATNIPPHNLSEIVNGVIALANNPEISIEELMEFVKGPDFPTGGTILGTAGIRNAYLTGKGSVTVRSKTTIEELKNGKARIIVSEIPYMVNKANMVEKIAELVKDKFIEGITDIRDETSRKGIRIVVEVAKNAVPEVVLNKLFKLTQLQTNFSVNTLALVYGQPEVLNLKRALEVYLEHQVDVVTRRTKFDLEKAQVRAHILEGLTIAIQNISDVIEIVRHAQTDAEAHEKLTSKYKLSIEQAKAITDMRLGRLTGLAIEKMAEELDGLHKEISALQNILSSRANVVAVIVEELKEIQEKFGDNRRTEIIDAAGSIDDEDLIPRKDVAITMSARGYVKRIPLEEYSVQNRGGVGSKSMSTYEDDDIEKILTTTTHTDLLIFTTQGRVYRIRAHQIPELSKQAKGVPFINLISLEKEEKVISLLPVDSYETGLYLFTVTKNGVVKKTALEEYSRINRNGKIALRMREDDMLIKVMIVHDEDEIIVGSSAGKVVRFKAIEVRSMGRTATGVKGINLVGEGKAKVVGASKTTQGEFVFSLGQDGYGKMTDVSQYRLTKRGGKGVKSIDVSKAGYLKFIEIVNGDEDILVITKQGVTIRTSLDQVAKSGRNAKGVKVITLKDNNAIKSAAIINVAEVKEKVEEAIRKTQEINLNSGD